MLAGIGHLQGTLHDRSIQIRLVRAKHGEVKCRFDSRRIARERDLNRQLARWARDHFPKIEACDPVLPPDCFNRLADNWRPLMAIAEIVGGDWPARAQTAFAQLTANADLEAQGRGALLLGDLRDLFAAEATDRLTTATIVERLNQMEERPWCDERHGHGVHASWLSRKLRPFAVYPGTIRTGVGPGETAKGYLLEHFQEAFDRYLPDTPSASRHTVTSPVNTGENLIFAPVTSALPVTVQNDDKTIENNGLLRCDGAESPQPDEVVL